MYCQAPNVPLNVVEQSCWAEDNSETLDTGNKYKLAEEYQALRKLLPNLRVIGGCCGTDHSHLEQICNALLREPVSQ